ncbi:MAG TPA: PAS domain S-box protein, partial [Blastocatellia bacterium]|nr:PAS domain S-box protein [Blastocatellia bacterium]
MSGAQQTNNSRVDLSLPREAVPLRNEPFSGSGLPTQLAILTIVAIIYLGAARVGLLLAFLNASVSPVWPPTGVAIAAVLLLGYRMGAAVFVGALVANIATGLPIATASAIAAGNTLEALAAGFLIHRFVGSQSPFYRAQDVMRFVLLAVLLSPMVSATIGNASLCLSGAAAWANFGSLWLTWWIGDGVGALVVAPLILTWVDKSSEQWSPRRLAEALLLLISVTAVSTSVFREALPSNFVNLSLGRLIIPFLIWAGFRLGPRGVATAIALYSGIAIWGTRMGLGPIVGQSPNDSLLLLQISVATNGITFLILAGVVAERKRAEQAVFFPASIVESTHDAVIGKTLDGRVLSWNKGAERLYGYAAEEVIGRSISILIPPERADELPRILEQIARGERIDRLETERVKKDGQRVLVSLTVSQIKNSAGKVVGASVIARDITKRRIAEEDLRRREEQLRLALEAANMGAWDYDVQTGTVRWSSSLEQIHGIPPGSFGGTFDHYLKDTHPDDRQRVMESLARTLEHDDEHDIEYRIIIPDGSVRWVEGKGVVIRDRSEKPIRMTGVCMDVTERKEAEREREDLLAREQAARAEAEAANRAKDEFLALVSHELRTPLNAIAGWVEILLANSARDEALIARGLEVVKRNAALQKRIIEDILDVSRIIAGKLQLEVRPVELSAVIHSAISAVQPAATAKDIRIRCALDPTDPLSGDPQRLQQITWNLLSNAIKFSPAGGEVEIRLRQIGATAHITVSDTGEGIPAEFLPRLFDRFSQADSSTTRKYGGLGLGLSIVQQLVELHGGTVKAESAGEKQGAVFTVSLPCIIQRGESPMRKRQPDDGEAQSQDAQALAGLRILIVDDDTDSRDALAALLLLHAAKVRSVATVRAALDVLTEWQPHVLVSDIGMPDQDGYDLIREVRARAVGDGGDIPAIALTGFAAIEESERALAAGYQIHIGKP